MACFVRQSVLRRQVETTSVLLVTLLVWGQPADCSAQGILQRLESRLRERVGPLAPIDRDALGSNTQNEAADEGGFRLRRRGLQTRELRRGDAGPTQGQLATPTASLGIQAVERGGRVPGLEIARIYPHSKAAEAGLRRGDVIVMLGKQPTPDIDAITSALRERRVGQTVQVRVVRGGAATNFDVELVGAPNPVSPNRTLATPLGRPRVVPPNEQQSQGQRQETAQRNQILPAPEPRPVTPNTRAAAARLTPGTPGVSPSIIGLELADDPARGGAVVTSVREGSPAAIAGINAKDRVLSVDGALIDNSSRLTQVIASRDPQTAVTLHIARDGNLIQRRVQLPGPDGATLDSQAASKQTTKAPGAQTEAAADLQETAGPGTSSGSVLSDFGSVVGGLFGGSGTGGTKPPAAGKAEPVTKGLPEAESAEKSGEAEAGPESKDQKESQGSESSSEAEELPAPLPEPSTASFRARKPESRSEGGSQNRLSSQETGADSQEADEEEESAATSEANRPNASRSEGQVATQETQPLRRTLLAADPPSLEDLESLTPLSQEPGAIDPEFSTSDSELAGLVEQTSASERSASDEVKRLVKSLSDRIEQLESRVRRLERALESKKALKNALNK